MIRKEGVAVVMVGLIIGIVGAGSGWVQPMTPPPWGTIQTWIDQFWWPATVIRCAVYALLAWGVYPVWVQEAIRQAQAVQAPGALDDDPQRRRGEARLRHLDRARQRSPWVFGALLLSDLVIAQFPYGLIRG